MQLNKVFFLLYGSLLANSRHIQPSLPLYIDMRY